MALNCRSCTKSFTTKRQLSRHLQEVHGDKLECNFCKKTVPARRKYLLEQHITKCHEGKPLSFTFIKRDNFRNPGEDRPRRITSRRSPRKSPSKSLKRPHVRQKSIDSHSTPVGETPGGPSTPITPLRSPSLSVPLSSPEEVNVYATSKRRVFDRSPFSTTFLSSSSPPRALIPPFSFAETSVPSGIVSASGDASSIGMGELPRAATETASSDVIPSVSPGPVLSLTETDETDHLDLFSTLNFDFLSDLDPHLQASPPNGAQESSLSAKPAAEPSLSVPTNQAKPVSVSSVPTSSQSRKTTVNTPPCILHKSESSPPSYQSEDLVNDPRFFFAGAPSFEKNDFVACLLQSTNQEARRQDGRKLSWLPLGSFAIERREELHFPDGRQYFLTSTICRNPHYTIKDAKSTQTDFSTTSSSSSSKCNVATQVSTVHTFTLGD